VSPSREQAQISEELAGNDARIEDAKYLEAGQQSKAASEFDALLGLDAPAEEKKQLDPAKLSE
jgi:hypothetical protein